VLKEGKRIIHYLNRQIRKHRYHYPKVKIARSFLLDAECYKIFHHQGKQYIRIMSLVPHHRVVIPLLGDTVISGNIRIILQGKYAHVHYTAKINSSIIHTQDNVIAVGDFVGHTNRKGDKFKCQHCRYVNHADWVAAMNLISRYYDGDITRYTPYRDVKTILLERFHRRLETEELGTIRGRILDTAMNEPTFRGQSESEAK